jgi:hypothetical protein
MFAGGVSGRLCEGQATLSETACTSSPTVAAAQMGVLHPVPGCFPTVVGMETAKKVGHRMGEIDKLLGIPEGQWYRSGMATSHEQQLAGCR